MAIESEVFNRDGKFKARQKARKLTAPATEPKDTIPTTGKKTSKARLQKPAPIELKADRTKIRIRNTLVTVLKPDHAFLEDISSRISALEKVIKNLDSRYGQNED